MKIIQEVLSNNNDLVIEAAEFWPVINATASWFRSGDLHLLRKCTHLK